ncbi:uncharacterized protein [Elaeis guineensis]|uniref:Uncharacterized protein LOC105035243 n=1 Tax=Elaeis guineensis var. tenera TaxID=51953 RepID=A0A6I9QI46_ELAGV|nr:uncharacterized protein LOC105035243 [Elaeis guineensis]XP_010909029.1 uncharacterized protein LOC105035243 [Elaeis guineensis]
MIVERLITVEYLDPFMSQELLGKFPDATAFDFDYSQSGIWSPLLPRGRHTSSSVFPMDSQKKFSDGSGILSPGILRKVKRKIIKKRKKQMVAPKRLDFSSSPTPKKGWNKVLRAAVKRFKIHRSPFQIMLPTL